MDNKKFNGLSDILVDNINVVFAYKGQDHNINSPRGLVFGICIDEPTQKNIFRLRGYDVYNVDPSEDYAGTDFLVNINGELKRFNAKAATTETSISLSASVVNTIDGKYQINNYTPSGKLKFDYISMYWQHKLYWLSVDDINTHYKMIKPSKYGHRGTEFYIMSKYFANIAKTLGNVLEETSPTVYEYYSKQLAAYNALSLNCKKEIAIESFNEAFKQFYNGKQFHLVRESDKQELIDQLKNTNLL